LGEHADFGSITLLIQDEIGGLQVKKTDGRWIEAKPIEGTILVSQSHILLKEILMLKVLDKKVWTRSSMGQFTIYF